MKRYDFHSHLGKTRSGDGNSAHQMVKELKAFGIEKVGIVSLSADSMIANNDIIYAAMKEYPDFVEGYADIDPKDPHAMDEIHRTLGEMKMNGVKFMSWKHGYNVENCPQLDQVIDEISKYGVHIQIHGGASPLCTPIVWLKYAKRYPDTNFVFTHICGREFGSTCIEAVKNIENFYVETSANMEYDILLKAKEVLGSKKILFGTDWPYKPTNIEIEKLYHLGFTEAELEDVFYKNAEKLWQRRL
ncbi:amidohydrolase family protein [Clostridium polynesiense]|uniref:amidohydrolase family protein n=1 Tax=Clostridium polynesiense TaxID=1325933 RepID=UPI00058F0815|nr:amidohydrolase family protein [Clostridium polynesiense]